MVPNFIDIDNQACNDKRSATQFEEIVGSSYTFYLQNVSKDVAKLLFQFICWRHICCRDGKRRFGQCLHVGFAAGRSRHLVELQVSRWHHILCQALANLHFQFVNVHSMVGGEVGTEMFLAVNLANHHDDLTDTFLLGYDTLNLTQFDTQTTQFHLVVGTS